MIQIENLVLDYKIQNENIKSLKEYLVNIVKGGISYTNFRAINNISFNINQGEIVGILGRNGAGKSSLLKVIAGVFAPTTGEVTLGGKIAPMLELGAGFDIDLTANENIFLNGALLGYDKKFVESKTNEILEFAELIGHENQPIRTFSSGMMMRLAFSIATIVAPEILIVDEVLSVGDSHFANKSKNRMRELMDGGTTVLMVSHQMEQIRSMCSRVIWLENGNIKMDGDPGVICDLYENEVV